MLPPTVAIVGAPNAGKSTLFNRLVRQRRALVSSQPGMTRDLNRAECAWGDRPVSLVDTGGLFAPGDPVLAGRVREQVLKAAAEADVLIFLVDGRAGLAPIDEELASWFHGSGRPVVLAVNKLDVPGRDYPAGEFHKLGFEVVVPISAEHDLGIDVLREAVSARLPADRPVGSFEASPAATRVAICGRPNVGKSSLLNALLGEERALVSEVPGTTRDSIDSLLQREGRFYRFIDTAGIRKRGRIERGAEALSVMSARKSIVQADVVLVVMDCTDAPTLQDLHVAGIAQQECRPFAVVLNKWDLRSERGENDPSPQNQIGGIRERLKFAPYAPILSVSALRGLRVPKILPMIDQIHEQATRTLSTGKLNSWLRASVGAHQPPAIRSGKPFRFYYIAQKASNPPAFLAFTNSPQPPHFSYRRYLENSLREGFGLKLTPIILRYRERPRPQRGSRAPRRNTVKRRV